MSRARHAPGLAFVVLLLAAPAAADSMVDFARCLGRKDAVMYGAAWCTNCRKQLEAFGRGADYVDYVECSVEGTGFVNPECERADIVTFPTWEFRDGSRLTGRQSLERLSQKTGCKMPEPASKPAAPPPAAP